MKRVFLVFLLFALQFNSVSAQQKLNFGLPEKQSVEELPVSKATVKRSVKKQYKHVDGKLSPDGETNYKLQQGWEMIEGWKLVNQNTLLWRTSPNDTGWYNATVPGTVLTTLVDQGIYPDPYYSLNNLQIPDTLCRMDWWYRIVFDMPDGTSELDYDLLLNGINYKAEVWLNREELGSISGAFIRGIFPLDGRLKKKGNILAIHILPPNNPGIPHEQNEKSFGPNGGSLCLDGPTFISSEGWDWIPGIRDRNIGIWQDVKLMRSDKIKMQDPFVISDLPLPDTSYADLTVKTMLVNVTDQSQEFILRGEIGEISFVHPVTLKGKEIKEIVVDKSLFSQLRLQHPRLWWPNGYGAQELYTLRLSLEQDGEILQQKNIRFGIRELSYELMAQTSSSGNIRLNYSPTDCRTLGTPVFNYKDPVQMKDPEYSEIYIPRLEKSAELSVKKLNTETNNPFLTILVNGQKIFCRGGNWRMDDGMKRVSRERLEPYMKLHKDMGFTMVRNWTGESTEDVFYSLCDEYGLLVWNDFMMSTEGFNLEPLDFSLFADNVQDVIRRFRNHPSIAIWCPRNEGYAPEKLEDSIQQIISSQDGTRHYHGNSRHLNLCPSGPWGYYTNSLGFLTKKAEGFTTELGAPAVPTSQTIRKFIPEEDLWPIGDVWYYHDMHIRSFDWKTYIKDVDKIGNRANRNVDEFAARAQFVNYNLYRNMFECWNSKMWEYTSGILLWMSHPAWPSMIWQTYSYDYETPGSYFGAKKACEPVHVQWNSITKMVQVVNTTLKSLSGVIVRFSVFDIKGKEIFSKETRQDVKPNDITTFFEASLPLDGKELYLVRTELANKSGEKISVNEYWVNPVDKNDFSLFGSLKNAKIKIKGKKKSLKFGFVHQELEIKNVTSGIALGIKLNVRNKENGEILLPAYFSDGYFNLLPGETRIIKVEIPSEVSEDTCFSAEGLNVESTYKN